MINSKNFIYSKAALARILNITPDRITRLEVWDRVVFVIIKGQRPRFYSKKLFKQEFVDFRKDGAEEIKITPHSFDDKRFLAYNKEKGTNNYLEIYTTFDNQTKSKCSCDDYSNQGTHSFYLTKELGKDWQRKCKHQIALEAFLGGNLKDYINELKAIDKEADYLQAKRDLFGDFAYC